MFEEVRKRKHSDCKKKPQMADDDNEGYKETSFLTENVEGYELYWSQSKLTEVEPIPKPDHFASTPAMYSDESDTETGASPDTSVPSPLRLQSYSCSPNLKMQGWSEATERENASQGSSSASPDRLSASTSSSDAPERQSSHESLKQYSQDELNFVDYHPDDVKNTYSYFNFLKSRSCVDIIPNSSKIIVFDSRLKVKKAFYALSHNGIRSAPLWNSEIHAFIGMLTITDFIHILIRYYKSPQEKMWEVEEHQIQTWRDLSQKDLHAELKSVAPRESIYGAVKRLMQAKIHRLPVIDPITGNALYILTHKKILQYVCAHMDDLSMPDFLGFTLEQLGIGTKEAIAVVNPWTPLIDALNIFAQRAVSALPVVDETNKCIDVYAKNDVLNLAAERTYNNLDMTVEDALRYRQDTFLGVKKCQPHETLYVIIERISLANVHRLIVVDSEDKALGIISLSDILKFLVLEPEISLQCQQSANDVSPLLDMDL